MEQHRIERLEAIMAAIRDRDPAAAFWLYAEFGGHVAAVVRRELRRLGVERVAADDLDGLVIDACLALFDCGAAWNPAGGAMPWTWAGPRLAAIASAWVGQHADPLDTRGVDHRPDPPLPPGGDEGPELDVLARLAESRADCALVLEALELVASPRDRVIVLELRGQMAAGDPSPARTVARRHGLRAEAVRQVACRVRRRLLRLAATDPRFTALSDLPIVAP